jgi:hypothetical protein
MTSAAPDIGRIDGFRSRAPFDRIFGKTRPLMATPPYKARLFRRTEANEPASEPAGSSTPLADRQQGRFSVISFPSSGFGNENGLHMGPESKKRERQVG